MADIISDFFNMINSVILTLQDNFWTASREIYWPREEYVHSGVPQVVYLMALFAALIMIVGIFRSMRFWFRGRYNFEGQGFISFFIEIIIKVFKNLFSFSVFKRLSWSIGTRIRNREKRGTMSFLAHLCIMFGFLGAMIATLISTAHEYLFHEDLLVGPIYYIYAIGSDFAGLLIIFGCFLAIIKRYVVDRDYYEYSDIEDFSVLFIAFFIGITGVIVEASRIYVSKMPDFEIVSFLGYGGALTFQFLNLDPNLILDLHLPIYLLHLGLCFLIAAMIPYSKFFHIGVGVASIILDDFDKIPKGKLDHNAKGINFIEDFTFKELFETSACMKCHFCHNYCPAQQSGELLSPLRLIQDIKNWGKKQYGLIRTHKGVSIHTPESGITEDVLWSCVTCYACVDACPHLIGHVDMIAGMRAALIEEGKIPATFTTLLDSAFNYGNVWGQPKKERTKWTKGLDFEIPKLKKIESGLLWLPGDTLAYDPRNQKVAVAMATVLNKAGIEFGILGKSEKNDGNDIRRLGEEALYAELAKDNIRMFKKNKASRIVTSSPHAYNTIKNEYPEFEDGKFDVVHYTQFLWELIENGYIKFTKELNLKVTYHDPCYLGRYNDVYDIPRKIIQAIPGVELVEMEHNRDKSLCCGGGGGGMFRDTPKYIENRISELRVDEAKQTEAQMIITACPFCTSMLVDATKTRQVEEELVVKDLVELVLEAMSDLPTNIYEFH